MFSINIRLCLKTINILDEYNGYSLLDAIQHGDIGRFRNFLSNETVNFRHFKTGNSSLVSKITNNDKK